MYDFSFVSFGKQPLVCILYVPIFLYNTILEPIDDVIQLTLCSVAYVYIMCNV